MIDARHEHSPTTARTTPDAVVGAGAQLRAAREAAGLSIDDVAQQLKLAPRQVQALEDEDFARASRPHVHPRLRAQLRASAATSTPTSS